jgi:hypothetical protein
MRLVLSKMYQADCKLRVLCRVSFGHQEVDDVALLLTAVSILKLEHYEIDLE